MKTEEKNEAGSSSEIYCYCSAVKKLKLRESCYVPPALKDIGGSVRKKKSN